MILTVTVNAALDITYTVDALTVGESHRVTSVHTRAGGKGINVARTLRALGQEAVVTGLAGGPTGVQLRAELAAAGLRDELADIAGDSRRTVTIASPASATAFNEPGPRVETGEWSSFLDRVRSLAAEAEAVVLAGSLPPGVPIDAYAQLQRIADPDLVIVDADADALRAALVAHPTIVKPNASELAAASAASDPLLAAGRLRAEGAQAVVASLGPEGLLAVTPEGTWRARPPERVEGNATGAGDACVAALAATRTLPWPERLREAVAVSAAAAAAPVAGDLDLSLRRRFRPAVELERLPAHAFERFA